MPPLTKDFKETVQARMARSASFRKGVLQEAVRCLLTEHDMAAGKALLRDYINGSVGYERVADVTGIPVKSLMRMLGPNGNPQARNLFALLAYLQRLEGAEFHVSLRRTAPTRGRAA